MTNKNSQLGLRRSDVRVVEPDPSCGAGFRAEAARLDAVVRAAGLPPLAFEHVGSTSVPGLAAKPIIDFMACYSAPRDADTYIDVLVSAGYEPRGPQGVPDRELLVVGPPDARTHYLNLVEVTSRFWRERIAFRDRLRGDSALAQAYAALKRELAARYPADRGAYTAAKARFVNRVLTELDLPR